jgi:hypothetical protein
MPCAAQAQSQSLAWEKLQAVSPDLEPLGWLKPRHSRDIASSPWSVGCETLDRDYADFRVYRDYVGALGVKHARLQSGWAKTEKVRGVYDFAWLDDCVYGLKQQGVEPWICICYGNPLYKSSGGVTTEFNLGAGLLVDEETLAAWCRYVVALVSHYKKVVKTWEIWNEPRFSSSAEAYANMLIRTTDAVRSVQPDATVMGFTVHGFTPNIVLQYPTKVFEILKAKGRLDVTDYVTYHPYTPNPDESYRMVADLEKLVRAYNPALKLYQGESGAPASGTSHRKDPWSEVSQVKWNLRRMAADRVRNIPSSIFTIIDLKYPDHLQSMGMIRSNEAHEFVYRRPSYYGVRNMACFFDDRVLPVGELEHQAKSARQMTVAGFTLEDKPVLLLWYKDRVPGDEIRWDRVDVRISRVRFRDPVYVEMITGRAYALGRDTWANAGDDVEFKGLNIWDSPVMLVERAQVDLMIEPE